MIVGTFIEMSIIQYLTRPARPKSTATTIQVDEIVIFEHVVNVINGPMIFVKMIHFGSNLYMREIFGNMVFSSVWKVLGAFVTFHRAIGGVGIAGVRVLCINFQNIVIHIGAKRLVKITCGLTSSLSLFLAVGLTVETALFAPDVILNTFRNHKPVPNENLSKSIFFRLSTSSCLIFNLVELICYVIIFVQMFKQHKVHVKLCLSNKPKLARKKRQRNTISAVGHFTSWAIEILIFGFLQFIIVKFKKSSSFSQWAGWLLGFFAFSINYVIFPCVQALTSEDLRDHVFNIDRFKEMYNFVHERVKSIVDCCKVMYKFVHRKIKCDKKDKLDVAVPCEEIELHA